ncbi:MAG: DUF421 domain-containing protein [Oscillospiraceae bacterium]|nr:DUF421 domain-containing protein [Oscillospiraceae bacterium]
MTTILIRLVLSYFITLAAMRAMGKRQIGQMQTGELVIAFFLSELAAAPIIDSSIPIMFGILPALALISLEVIFSYLSVKIPLFKVLFDVKPSLLISKGKMSIDELQKARMTSDELLSRLRLCGVFNPADVYYAILEPNGELSVLLRSSKLPPVFSDFPREARISIPSEEPGIAHAIIEDGKPNKKALSELSMDLNDLNKLLEERGLPPPDDIFLLTSDENSTLYFTQRKQRK